MVCLVVLHPHQVSGFLPVVLVLARISSFSAPLKDSGLPAQGWLCSLFGDSVDVCRATILTNHPNYLAQCHRSAQCLEKLCAVHFE